MRTRKRRIYNRDNKKTKKHLHRPRLSMKSKNKKKSRKRGNKKIKKTRKRKEYSRAKTDGRGFLDDPFGAYTISILDEEPVIVSEEGEIIDDDTRFRKRLQEYFDNDLKNSMIRWKRTQRKRAIAQRAAREAREHGWVNVSAQQEKLVDENNYIKYLLDEIPENITDKKRDDWRPADKVDLSEEAKAVLKTNKLKNENGKNYWLDSRVLGHRWRGLFNRTSADDVIKEMELPTE